MSARQICNAALPLKPLIHKTLLPTLIIHVSVCVACAPARGRTRCSGTTRRGKGGRARVDITRAPNAATHVHMHVFQALLHRYTYTALDVYYLYTRQ